MNDKDTTDLAPCGLTKQQLVRAVLKRNVAAPSLDTLVLAAGYDIARSPTLENRNDNAQDGDHGRDSAQDDSGLVGEDLRMMHCEIQDQRSIRPNHFLTRLVCRNGRKAAADFGGLTWLKVERSVISYSGGEALDLVRPVVDIHKRAGLLNFPAIIRGLV